MIYILNIGYHSFAFPTMRGLQTVIETLGKASQLKHSYYPGCESDPERIAIDPDPPKVSLHVVSGVSFVKGKSRHDVIEPEVLPRQRNGATPFEIRTIKTFGPKEVSARSRLMIGEGK